MVEKSKGARRGTRSKLSSGLREKFTPERMVQAFKQGDKVVIKPCPYSHKGMPNSRFHGAVGTVLGTRGRAYMLEFRIGGKKKAAQVRPEHLKAAVK